MPSVKEAAERIGVSPSTVYRWVDIGALKATCTTKPSPIERKRRYKGNIDIPEAQILELQMQVEAA